MSALHGLKLSDFRVRHMKTSRKKYDSQFCNQLEERTSIKSHAFDVLLNSVYCIDPVYKKNLQKFIYNLT